MTKQPACLSQASQVSVKSVVGWGGEGGRNGQDSSVELTFPPIHLVASSQPHTVWRSLKEERREQQATPKAALKPKEGERPQPRGVGAVGVRAAGCQTPLIRQTACHHLSPGSSFEGQCQEGGPGGPRLRGWRGWATDQPLWPVLPGTCQILEKQERGWGWALRPEQGMGCWAGPGPEPTTFTGDAFGLFRVIPLRKQKGAEVSWVGWGGAGQGEAGLRLLNQSEPDLNHGPPSPTRVTWPWVPLSLFSAW